MKNELEVGNGHLKVPKINFKVLFSKNVELISDHMEYVYESFSSISDKALSVMEEIPLPVPKKYKAILIRYGEFGQRILVRMIDRYLHFYDLFQTDPERLKSSPLFKKEYGWRMEDPEFSYRDSIHDSAKNYLDYTENAKWRIEWLTERMQCGTNSQEKILELQQDLITAKDRLKETEKKSTRYARWSELLTLNDIQMLLQDNVFVKEFGFWVKREQFDIHTALANDIQMAKLCLEKLENHLKDFREGKIRLIRCVRDIREMDAKSESHSFW